MTRWIKGLLCGALLLAAGGAGAQTVQVGSKNFTEQYILAEIYAQAIENAGIKVSRKINLGGTLIAQKALTSGEIDLYPEYTGTALLAVMKAEVSSDPQKVYDQVKAYYEKEFSLTWLKPTGINNGYAIIVRPETAAQYKLTTLSDLAGASRQLVLGAGTEFLDRWDGIPGLKGVYGVEFKAFRQFAKLGLRYDALAAKQVDVANGFATDWQIEDQKLVTLRDDKDLFPPYFVAPVIRQSTLAAQPRLAEILDRVSATLDTDTMRRLNAEVERDRQEPADVARAFLKSKGLAS